MQNQHEKCLVIQLTWCYFSRDFEKLVFAPFLANIMAKYICSKNIGLTICALFSLSVTILILLLNLIRLGHEIVDQKEDKDKNNLSSEKFGFDKSSKDEIMNLKLERIGSRYWEDILHQLLDNKSGRNNQDWTNSDKMVDERTRGSMMKDQSFLPSFRSSEVNLNEAFKFNIKLNSFSKESNDLLD